MDRNYYFINPYHFYIQSQQFDADAAFVTNHYLFALVWFVYTGIVALFGVSRLLERGWKPLEEIAIDSAFIYLF